MENTPVYTRLDEIIESANKENKLSLCQFRPSEIISLEVEDSERQWSQAILGQIEAENAQGSLFEDMKREIKLVKKVPYKFSYRFADDVGKESTLMIEDWEINALYWRCLKESQGDERVACQKVKEKYQGFIENNDLILFLGTTRQFHGRAKNPFVIIGVFYPPKNPHPELF